MGLSQTTPAVPFFLVTQAVPGASVVVAMVVAPTRTLVVAALGAVVHGAGVPAGVVAPPTHPAHTPHTPAQTGTTTTGTGGTVAATNTTAPGVCTTPRLLCTTHTGAHTTQTPALPAPASTVALAPLLATVPWAISATARQDTLVISVSSRPRIQL